MDVERKQGSMSQFVVKLGRSGTGKSYEIFQEIKKAEPGQKHVILVPDQISHMTERELCGICGNSISLRAEVLTFSRLCTQVFHQCGGEHEPELDKAGRMILLEKAVSQCYDRLEVLQYYTQQAGFYEKLVKTLEELKSNRVSTETLFSLDSELVRQGKIRDIAMILGFYDSYTQNLAGESGSFLSKAMGVAPGELSHQLVGFDPRDRISRLADKLADSSWAEGKCYWVDGFADFTPQQLEILRELWLQGEGMTLCLLGEQDMSLDVDSLFAPTAMTLAQLETMVKAEGKRLELQYVTAKVPVRKEVLQHLEQELFQHSPTPYSGKVDQEITLFSAVSMHSEVEWLASEIRRLVMTGAYRYRDILVVGRDFSKYLPLLQSVFPRYDIPLFASGVNQILEKPVISVIHTVFQLINGDFATEDMIKYMKTGFSQVSLAKADQMENYVLMWDLQHWRSPWTRHTKRYDADISWEKLQEMIESDAEDFPEKLRAYAQNANALATLNQGRKQLMAPLLRYEQATKGISGKQQCQVLYRFLVEMKLYWKIKHRQEALEEEGNFTQSAEYSQLWEVVCRALEQCHQLLGEEEMDFRSFSKVFTLALSQYSVSTIPSCLDQVTAGETTRMKSHRGKVVFWIGCEDSVVPKVTSSGGLLTDLDRAVLKTYQISLNQEEDVLLYREVTTAYEICALAQEKLYFSYSCSASTGETLRPSFLITGAMSLFPGLSLVEEENLAGVFRLRAPLPALEQAEKFPFVKELLQDSPEFGEKVAQLEKAKQWNRGTLSALGVQALYGKQVVLSATGLNKLNSCAFSYFMYYGLGARKREKMEFNAAAYGNMVHHTLEVILKDYLYLTDKAQKRILGEKAPAQVKEILADYRKNQLGDNHTARELFLLERMEQYVTDVVKEVVEEMNRSHFAYLGGEVKFRLPLQAFCGNSASQTGMELWFQGSIDRIDGHYEKDHLYFHTIDYKTGNKVLDFGHFYAGRDLQLFLYYLALVHLGAKPYENLYKTMAKPEEVEIAMAGLSYLPGKTEVKREEDQKAPLAKIPPAKKPSPKQLADKAERERRAAALAVSNAVTNRLHVRHTGVYTQEEPMLKVLEQPVEEEFRYLPLKKIGLKPQGSSVFIPDDVFEKLTEHTKIKLAEVVGQLESGDISANPFFKTDTDNSCQFCDYKNYCHYDPEQGGDCQRQEEHLVLSVLLTLLP